jgi:phosphatidylglycerol:prolipoprotein diacylglycerol transferase
VTNLPGRWKLRVRRRMLAYYIHQLSPFIVRFGSNAGLRWYGFAYVLAFACGYWLLHWLAQKGYGELAPAKVADFITLAAILGVMLGGRLGWIVFYGWGDIRADPWNAFKLWQGGMSSHGGILGLFLFTWVYARWQKISWPGLGDNLVVVAPIGLFFGRLANFINGELWGRVITSAPPPAWAMRFPKEAEGQYPDLVAQAYAHDPTALAALSRLLPLRHPSQLYEASLEGVVLFTILWLIRTRLRAPVGVLTGTFFLGYAVLRIFGEQFREPDVGIPLTWGLSRGQFLSLFMFVIAAGFYVYAYVTRYYQLPGRAGFPPAGDKPPGPERQP